MKRKLFFTSIALLTVLLSVSAGAYAASKIQLIINGKEINADIKVIKGTTYVPLRVISENLEDVTLNYDSDKNRITIENTKPVEPPYTPPVIQNGAALSRAELQKYLTDNFSKLETSIGETTFTFTVEENDSTYHPYDFWIKTNYNVSFFHSIESGIKITDENKRIVKSEIKSHMEKIAQSSIAKMPGKKLQGNYHYEYYRYPTIKEGLVTSKYYSWKNFSGSDFFYKNNVLSDFMWHLSDLNSL